MTTNTRKAPTADEVEAARLKAANSAEHADWAEHDRLLRDHTASRTMQFEVAGLSEADRVANRARFDGLLDGSVLEADTFARILRAADYWVTARTRVADNPAYLLAEIDNDTLITVHGMAAIAAAAAPKSLAIREALRLVTGELAGRLAALDETNPF